MTPIFPDLPRKLGVYTLTRLIELRQNTALYEARQTHVDRAVVLEVLTPGATQEEEMAFLAQARLRVASSELPHVANVFESLRAEGLWFLTQELPLGRSLEEIGNCGEQLSVVHICRIILAAAEMYDLCNQVELQAMPLSPASIFIENNGTVHFLSPLIEGSTCPVEDQMQAMAAALTPVFPQHKMPGLGRAATLLQWMQYGYEGQFLPWHTLGEAASTIFKQLDDDKRRAIESTLSYKLTHNRVFINLRSFTRRWAVYLVAYCVIIVLLTGLGSFFGMANPVRTAAGSKEAFLCQQGDVKELVLRQPVSVGEYEAFLRFFESADEDTRLRLTEDVPEDEYSSIPQNWDQQQKEKKPGDPVTGISYWQALVYARHAGGSVPTANQLQAIRTAGIPLLELEWSRTEDVPQAREVYGEYVYLLINSAGAPLPARNRHYAPHHCGFRLCMPESAEE